jgi:hypothetical protein
LIAWEALSPFTGGVIRRVIVDIGNDQHPTPKAPKRRPLSS